MFLNQIKSLLLLKCIIVKGVALRVVFIFGFLVSSWVSKVDLNAIGLVLH